MALTVFFTIPLGMTLEGVATTFAAYVLGPRAFDNALAGDQRRLGPFKKESVGNVDYEVWQLDPSNDFWVHLNETGGNMFCRYASQEPVVNAAIMLFRARFDCDPFMPGRDHSIPKHSEDARG